MSQASHEVIAHEVIPAERRVVHDVLHDETIVAVATPPGRGALAIVRLSGADAHRIAQSIVTPWPHAARHVGVATARDARGTTLDQVVVTRFDAPHSFTGEDLVEFSTHGGAIAPVLLTAACIAAGAREARPGEFTRRAVLNGKIDLVQGEAIGDLIDAPSRAMHLAALVQLNGGLSDRITALREQIIGLEALIAYDIDFPEEDDGPIPRTRITEGTTHLLHALDALLATAPVGELLREGAVVVIAGPPNVGKSSLFNALLGVERAIVTDVPGTTRDAIEAVLDTTHEEISWPLRLVDTAGLRDTKDIVERLGIEVSTRYLAGADVVIACGTTDAEAESTAETIRSLSSAPVVMVRTKIDLSDESGKIRLVSSTASTRYIPVSATAGVGLRPLLSAINAAIAERYGHPPMDAPILMRARQRYAIESARSEIQAFHLTWSSEELPAPVVAVHLRAAAHALEDVIGAVSADDVLARVFSTFCVGK